jgi:uncharacterized YccA/Bax inhibitor family protein
MSTLDKESTMMRTSNPALNDKTFENFPTVAAEGEGMSLQGTVNKTALLLALVVAPAVYTWSLISGENPQALVGWLIGGILGGAVFALITVFKKEWSAVTAPLYAMCEGLALGGISGMLEQSYPGIVLQAVSLTFGTLVLLLVAYTSGWIRATENFKLGVFAATGAIALIYVVTMVLGFFGITMPYIHDSGIIGIGFSLFVVGIAALNLILDFDFIEKGCDQGAPKYMEWYSAFGLMVTLIWLYLEILRLLAKLRSRD